MTAIPKPKRIRDAKYVDWIKTLPCLVRSVYCLGDIDPHHVIPEGGGITGGKVSDYRCVPLCRWHHDGANMRAEFERLFDIDLEEKIDDLRTAYRHLFATVAPRKTRTLQPTAKLRIEHCVCGKPHVLPYSKCHIRGLTEGIFLRYRCPVSNEQQQARLA